MWTCGINQNQSDDLVWPASRGTMAKHDKEE